METHFKVIGVLLLGLALVHCIFPRYFNWKDELSKLSLINRQMMQVHTLFIAFVLLLMGLLCLTSIFDLLSTTLGHRVCLGLGLFWLARLLVQFFWYSPKLWRGKISETTIHVLFVMLWCYLSAVFLIVGLTGFELY